MICYDMINEFWIVSNIILMNEIEIEIENVK